MWRYWLRNWIHCSIVVWEIWVYLSICIDHRHTVVRGWPSSNVGSGPGPGHSWSSMKWSPSAPPTVPIVCACPWLSSRRVWVWTFFFDFDVCPGCFGFGTTMGTIFSDVRTVPSFVLVCVTTTSWIPLMAFGIITSLGGTIISNRMRRRYVWRWWTKKLPKILCSLNIAEMMNVFIGYALQMLPRWISTYSLLAIFPWPENDTSLNQSYVHYTTLTRNQNHICDYEMYAYMWMYMLLRNGSSVIGFLWDLS